MSDRKEEVVVPQYSRNLRYLSNRILGFHRNRFVLNTMSAVSAGPNRQIRFSMPENSVIDLASLKFQMTVKTNGQTSGGGSPINLVAMSGYANDFLYRVQVFMNGVQISSGMSEWNSCWRLKQAAVCNNDHDESVDTACCNVRLPNVAPTYAATDAQEINMAVMNWFGILGAESSVRYLDTSLCGRLEVVLTSSPVEGCLTPCLAGAHTTTRWKNPGAAYDEATLKTILNNVIVDDLPALDPSPSDLTYNMSDFWETCDSISIDDGLYDYLLRKRIQEVGWLNVNCKEYYSFLNDQSSATAYQARYSVSSQSIDKIFASQRLSTYANYPKQATPSHTLPSTELYPLQGHFINGVPNWYAFKSFDTPTNGARYQASINNVKHPTARQNKFEVMEASAYANECVPVKENGNQICSVPQFDDCSFVDTTRLNLGCDGDDALSVYQISGFDSRGVNTIMTWEPSGMKDDAKSSLVLVETSMSIRVGQGKQIATIF